MRTGAAILAALILLVNLACAATCALKECQPRTKVPPCHQQQPVEKACDHKSPAVDGAMVALDLTPVAAVAWAPPIRLVRLVHVSRPVDPVFPPILQLRI